MLAGRHGAIAGRVEAPWDQGSSKYQFSSFYLECSYLIRSLDHSTVGILETRPAEADWRRETEPKASGVLEYGTIMDKERRCTSTGRREEKIYVSSI